LVDIGVLFRGCLYIRHVAILLAKSLKLSRRDLAILFFHVKFITNDNEWKGLWHCHHTLREEGLFPVCEALKSLLVSEVEDQQATVGTSIESSTQRLIPLLAGCVPNLQSNDAAIHSNLFIAEIGTNRRLERLCELKMLKHLY
jgi:hypothetical protein